MNKLIELIIAAVVFWAIYFYLVPLLPSPAREFIGVIAVVIAIVYLLSTLVGYPWPWNK